LFPFATNERTDKTKTTGGPFMMHGGGFFGGAGGFGAGGFGMMSNRRFEEQYHCYSVAYADKSHLEVRAVIVVHTKYHVLLLLLLLLLLR
jgi:hypothetical protein